MTSSAISNPEATTPSSQRCEPGSVNPPIAKWPKSTTQSVENAAAVVQDVISKLNTHLSTGPSKQSAAGVASLFAADSYWRDHLALSWELQTLKTRESIASFLDGNSSLTGVEVDSSTEYRAPRGVAFNPEGTCGGIQSYLSLTTKLGRGRGVVKLVEEEGAWKIWTLFTALEELTGFEEPRGPRRPNGVQHGFHHGRKNWLDRRQDEENFTDSDPDVLIIGTIHSPSSSSPLSPLLLTPPPQAPAKPASAPTRASKCSTCRR